MEILSNEYRSTKKHKVREKKKLIYNRISVAELPGFG